MDNEKLEHEISQARKSLDVESISKDVRLVMARSKQFRVFNRPHKQAQRPMMGALLRQRNGKSGRIIYTTLEIRLCLLFLILTSSGLGPFNFAATNFQNLLNQAGFDPAISTPGNPQPCGTGDCYLVFAGKPQSINAIVLNASGIATTIQSVLLLSLGSLADYGKWRPLILIVWTVISWGVGFG
jgi:Vacuole effluxer Atg22 like